MKTPQTTLAAYRDRLDLPVTNEKRAQLRAIADQLLTDAQPALERLRALVASAFREGADGE